MTPDIAGMIVLTAIGGLSLAFGILAWIADHLPIDRPDSELEYQVQDEDPYIINVQREEVDAWDAPVLGVERG